MESAEINSPFDTLLALAQGGDPKDQKDFAYYCLNTPQHYMKALEWFKRLAIANDGESQYILWFMYRHGLGRPSNQSIADNWRYKAKKNGYTTAPDRLAEIFPAYVEDDASSTESQPTNKEQQEKSFNEVLFGNNGNDNRLVIWDGESESENKTKSKQKGKTVDDYLAKCEYLYDHMELVTHTPDPNINPEKILESLIGLKNIKQQIQQMKRKVLFNKKRQEKGFITRATSNHFVFTGNPGTGKNEVSRILGHILLNIGVLPSGHVIEVSAGELEAGWYGHTALKTRSVVNRALGGVLFIDEAYSLLDKGHWNTTGAEALSTLLKMMEDHRDDLVVIMAGYPDKMAELIRSNPGLKSRFRHNLHFDDYSPEELCKIYEKFCAEEDFIVHSDTIVRLNVMMQDAVKYENNQTLGNGRFVRNVFEKTIEKMSLRVMSDDNCTDDTDLQTILFCDLPSFEEIGLKPSKNRILK